MPDLVNGPVSGASHGCDLWEEQSLPRPPLFFLHLIIPFRN